MNQKEMLAYFQSIGYLNEKGLNAYISYLRGDIQDLKEKRKQATSKGAAVEPRNYENGRKGANQHTTKEAFL